MIRACLLFIAFHCLFAIVTLAGITGKIRGKVIDNESKQPIAGVSILILGTKMGAATNIEGEYYILNVPVGEYKLRSSSIGYNALTVQDVHVSADLTTEINFSLVSEAVEVKEVVITAERPLIQQDVTASVSIVEAEQLQALPVTSFSEAMVLSTGFVESKNGNGEGIHLRGGRSRELSYLVDGVRADNILFSGLGSDVPRLGVSSLTVMSGTFNAEYGQAQSGVINVVTQDGGDKFWGKTRFSSDRFGGKKNNLGTNIMEFAVSGPIISDASFFFSADRERSNTYLNKTTGPEYFSPSGRIIQNEFEFGLFDNKDRAQIKLSLKPTNETKVQIGTIYFDRKHKDYDQTFKEYPQYQGFERNKSLLNNLTFTHTLSQSSFYEIRMSYFDYKEQYYVFDEQLSGDHRKIFAPVLSNVSFDSTGNYQFWGPYNAFLYLTEAQRQGYKNLKLADSVMIVNGLGDTIVFDEGTVITNNLVEQFIAGGRNLSKIKVSVKVNSYDDSYRDARTRTLTASANFTSQLDGQNNIKFGIEYKKHIISDYWINGVNANWNHLDDTLSFERRHYDLVDYSFDPLQLAAYIQDKFEYKSMIFNVGIRFDYLDVQAPDVYDFLTRDPRSHVDSLFILQKRSETVPARYKFSPRFGFSFPITTQAKIHFSYGHFYQYPDFNFLYRRFREQNPTFLYLGIGQSLGAIGNPRLKPETTQAYELGGEYIINENMVAAVRMFYKDTYDYISTQPIFTPDNHTRIANLDYANSRGIEFSLEKRFAHHYAFTINYTYSRAEGNADQWSTHSNEVWNASVYGFVPPKKTVVLAWDQPHTLTLNLRMDYENYGGSIIGDIGSGLPYSPREPRGKPIGDINSGRQPWTSTFDMRIYRALDISPVKITLYLDVKNIFDRKNVLNVFDTTGEPNYNTNPAASPESMHNPSFYGPMRHILLGLELEF
ncbi:MAG: TonB-dependent receptor [Ignavibacteria bacterium]|nr:TonB-dependent receptor [Ignavibacteria bacterium]